MKSRKVFLVVLIGIAAGCGKTAVKPVDIFSEDMCSFCRMTVSDQSFASEIITGKGDALKFDDIGCMEEYWQTSKDVEVAATFVKDYETKSWIPMEKSTIVVTCIATPMGSGKIAFADSAKAVEYLKKYPLDGSAETKKER